MILAQHPPTHGSIWHGGQRVDYERRHDAVELIAGNEFALWMAQRDGFPGSQWAIPPQTIDGHCWMAVLHYPYLRGVTK